MQRWRPSAATTKRGGLRPPLSVVSLPLALNQPHVLPLYTAHVFRRNKADVLALSKAHALRLNTKVCPVFTAFTANAKDTAFRRLHKGGRPSVEAAEGRLLRVGCDLWAYLTDWEVFQL